MKHSLAALIFLILVSPQAMGQEADTLMLPGQADRDSLSRWQPATTDSTGQWQPIPVDSTGRWQPITSDSTEFVPLWESDTLYQGRENDTLKALVQAPRVRGDTLSVADTDHSPEKATMYALVLPGLGQVYNKKIWKVPIVWGAIGGAGWAIWYNSGLYNKYSRQYAEDPTSTNEKYLKYTRRNMELSYIAMVAVYALQVVDAYVDAQLYYWDVNEALAMGVRPSVQPLLDPNSLTGTSVGLTCSIKIKGR